MGERGTAIVTGGGSGIGLATAACLLRDGWKVAVADLVAENLAAAETILGDAGRERLRFERLDVTDEAAVTRIVAACDAEFGPVRGLVNSAGIGRDVPFFDTTTDMFRRLMEVNVVATFAIAREAAKAMKAHGGGAIVNIASVSGQRGNIGRSAYGASKGAVVNLTRVMAVELADHGIRVNAVAPGPVETAMVREIHSEEIRAIWTRAVPQRRYGQPEEIAEAVAYLLDDDKASYVTGQILSVDGGFTAGGLLHP